MKMKQNVKSFRLPFRRTSQPNNNNNTEAKDYHFVHFDFKICTVVRQFKKLMQFNKGIINQTQMSPKFLTYVFILATVCHLESGLQVF